MYLVSKESFDKCRSSNFNENLMKNLKKIRKCKCKNSEKNKVWGLTQEISVVSNESNRKCKRSGDLKRKLTYADGRTPDKSVSDKLRLTKVSRSQKREPSPRTCVEGTASSPLSPPPTPPPFPPKSPPPPPPPPPRSPGSGPGLGQESVAELSTVQDGELERLHY